MLDKLFKGLATISDWAIIITIAVILFLFFG